MNCRRTNVLVTGLSDPTDRNVYAMAFPAAAFPFEGIELPRHDVKVTPAPRSAVGSPPSHDVVQRAVRSVLLSSAGKGAMSGAAAERACVVHLSDLARTESAGWVDAPGPWAGTDSDPRHSQAADALDYLYRSVLDGVARADAFKVLRPLFPHDLLNDAALLARMIELETSGLYEPGVKRHEWDVIEGLRRDRNAKQQADDAAKAAERARPQSVTPRALRHAVVRISDAVVTPAPKTHPEADLVNNANAIPGRGFRDVHFMLPPEARGLRYQGAIVATGIELLDSETDLQRTPAEMAKLRFSSTPDSVIYRIRQLRSCDPRLNLRPMTAESFEGTPAALRFRKALAVAMVDQRVQDTMREGATGQPHRSPLWFLLQDMVRGLCVAPEIASDLVIKAARRTGSTPAFTWGWTSYETQAVNAARDAVTGQHVVISIGELLPEADPENQVKPGDPKASILAALVKGRDEVRYEEIKSALACIVPTWSNTEARMAGYVLREFGFARKVVPGVDGAYRAYVRSSDADDADVDDVQAPAANAPASMAAAPAAAEGMSRISVRPPKAKTRAAKLPSEEEAVQKIKTTDEGFPIFAQECE